MSCELNYNNLPLAGGKLLYNCSACGAARQSRRGHGGFGYGLGFKLGPSLLTTILSHRDNSAVPSTAGRLGVDGFWVGDYGGAVR